MYISYTYDLLIYIYVHTWVYTYINLISELWVFSQGPIKYLHVLLASWLRIARIDIQGCLEMLGMNSLGMLDYESQHGVNLGFQCHSCLAKPMFLCLLCFSTSLGVGNYMLKADIKVCSQRFQASWLCAVLNHQLFVEVVHLTCTNNKRSTRGKAVFTPQVVCHVNCNFTWGVMVTSWSNGVRCQRHGLHMPWDIHNFRYVVGVLLLKLASQRCFAYRSPLGWMQFILLQWKKGPWLFGVYIGKYYTTQVYRDYLINHEIRIPINQPV